jgi:hypothetical protein
MPDSAGSGRCKPLHFMSNDTSVTEVLKISSDLETERRRTVCLRPSRTGLGSPSEQD